VTATRVPILTPIAGLLLAISAVADELAISAVDAEATIAPRFTPRKEVALPALDFEIRAEIRCEGKPVSVTLSVADVHRSFEADALGEDGILETTIRVPSEQLALVIAGSSFCLGDTIQADETLRVPGVALAQGSLTCSTGSGVSIHYASTPLPLRLTCLAKESASQPESSPAR